jgi:hypothetical protein
MDDAKEEGVGGYEQEWRIYGMIAAAVNSLDPTLAARPGEDSPGIFNVRVRLAATLAAYFGQDVTWSGAVARVAGEGAYEWEDRGGEHDYFSFDAPALDFDGTAATNPVYEQEKVVPVAVTEETISRVAQAIVVEATGLRFEHSEKPGAVGYELLELYQDVANPKPDRRRERDWRSRESFEKGTRFILILREGGVPSLYPAVDYARHEGALPSSPLFAALMSGMTTSWPKLREIIALEGADAADVLDRLVAGGTIEYDVVVRAVRSRREEAVAAKSPPL